MLVNLEDFVKCSEKATFIEYDYNKFEREDKEQNRTTPLTEKEINATKKSQINPECPAIANPNYVEKD